MKSILLIILLLFHFEQNDIYIKSTYIDKTKIKILFNDKTNIKTKIKKENSKRYFNVNNNRIYLDVDIKAKCHINIDSLIKIETIRPKYNSNYLPIIYLVFIINENGKIIYQGLDREFCRDDYQNEFDRVMKFIKADFDPAVVDGKRVSSLIKFHINYYQLFDNEKKR